MATSGLAGTQVPPAGRRGRSILHMDVILEVPILVLVLLARVAFPQVGLQPVFPVLRVVVGGPILLLRVRAILRSLPVQVIVFVFFIRPPFRASVLLLPQPMEPRFQSVVLQVRVLFPEGHLSVFVPILVEPHGRVHHLLQELHSD